MKAIVGCIIWSILLAQGTAIFLKQAEFLPWNWLAVTAITWVPLLLVIISGIALYFIVLWADRELQDEQRDYWG